MKFEQLSIHVDLQLTSVVNNVLKSFNYETIVKILVVLGLAINHVIFVIYYSVVVLHNHRIQRLSSFLN
jgi:hypothetical protein